MRLSKSSHLNTFLPISASDTRMRKQHSRRSLKSKKALTPSKLLQLKKSASRSSTRSLLPGVEKSQSLPKSSFSRNGRRSSLTMPATKKPVNCVSKCAYKTKTGSVNGRVKPHNQDAYLIAPYLQNQKHQYLFGVFDGHGSVGHEVSSFIKTYLPRNIEYRMTQTCLTSAIHEGIALTCRNLNDSGIDISFSGSTLSLVIIRSTELVCANVGDSRAVLGKKIQSTWVGAPLSRDHKPDLEDEYTRIVKANGRVMACLDETGKEVGPLRVWLQNEQTPGLAMSRSIGDKVAHSVGVSSKAELFAVEIAKEDKFIVLASDGVWEFMTSQETVEIVGSCIDRGKADSCCSVIVKEAAARWRKEEQVVDDITAVVVFLK